MAKCCMCGRYSDPYEWPEDHRENYRPNLCFSCFQEQRSSNDDDSDDDDTTTEFGMPEIRLDPEDDDAPNLPELENDNDDNEMEETHEESEPLPDETLSIENIKRMLFG